MVKYQAIGPLSIMLQSENLFHDNISVCSYRADELEKLLGKDQGYWSEIYFSLDYKKGYWLKLELEENNIDEAWKRAVAQTSRFLEALGLFKSVLSKLAVGGLYLKMIGKGEGPTGQFGWTNPIVGERRYLLKKEEYDGFLNLLTKYERFWHDNKVDDQPNKQLQRINLARSFFLRSLQTTNLADRHIFLSIVLEALIGEETDELTYRYSNRAALLLGDDVRKRKAVYSDVRKAYITRSKILHGDISWIVEPKEFLNYSEIIRQMILRCISLYTQDYRRIGNRLDECLHDPEKHTRLLVDAKALFGSSSEYQKTTGIYK